MELQWMWTILLLVVTVSATEVTDEDYSELPPLFHLQEYEECAGRGGVFCLGTFSVTGPVNGTMLKVMKKISDNKYYFDHTRLHRGYCVSKTCPQINDTSLKTRFARCTKHLLHETYNITVEPIKIEYCKIGSEPAVGRPVDAADLVYAAVVGVLLLLNVIGTTYHVLRRSDKNANQCLTAWSVVANYKRLTANYHDGDPRLSALNPTHGIKTLTLIMVMCAHTIISHYMTYLENPDFLEKTSYHPLVTFLHNGTVIVQTFVVLSSFLVAYNLLLHVDDHPLTPLSLRMLPQCVLHRVARVTPIQMIVVGAVATWWPRVGDGPLWAPLIEAELERCRHKWWTHALYINNLVYPEEKCLIQTWYLAVDMQLYILAAVLTLTLGQKTMTALKVVGGLFLTSIVGNFVLAYNWNLKPMLFITEPELLRTEFLGEPSFTWLYMSPWGSAPASLVGLMLALLYHHLQRIEFKPAEHLWMRVVHRLSVPCMLAWMFGGWWMRDLRSRTVIALYAALDRPVFALLITTAIFGFFCKIDNVWWRMMSWRAWRVPSRMSLSVLMVHWSFTLMQVALTAPTHSSIGNICIHWALTVSLSYVTAVPLYILVESPAQRFIQAICNSLTGDNCYIYNIQNLFTSHVVNKLLYSHRELNRNLSHNIPSIVNAESANIPQSTVGESLSSLQKQKGKSERKIKSNGQ